MEKRVEGQEAEAFSERVELLGECPTFSGLPKEDLEALAHIITDELHLEKGGMIFDIGEDPHAWYIIKNGRVYSTAVDPLSFTRASCSFGRSILLAEETFPVLAGQFEGRPYFSKAIVDSEEGADFLVINRKSIYKILAVSSDVLTRFIQRQGDLEKDRVNKVKELDFKNSIPVEKYLDLLFSAIESAGLKIVPEVDGSRRIKALHLEPKSPDS